MENLATMKKDGSIRKIIVLINSANAARKKAIAEEMTLEEAMERWK